ncbi:MAG: carbon monoxide dehydrogenase subunit G [Gemmatimonadales bacterium]|nr:carbon monoxide dehydrogenase subunit G [Gemmatimonadales bacterium]
MRMSFGGAPEIRASRAQVWRALLDPNTVAASASAIQSVEAQDATHFTVVAGLGIGALKLKFKLNAELFDIVDGQSAKLRARGKAPGSTLDVVTSFELEDAGPGVIRLHWKADSEVGGTVASVGARLLEGTSRRLAEEFWRDFADSVSRSAAAT